MVAFRQIDAVINGKQRPIILLEHLNYSFLWSSILAIAAYPHVITALVYQSRTGEAVYLYANENGDIEPPADGWIGRTYYAVLK